MANHSLTIYIPFGDPFREPLLIIEALLMVLTFQLGIIYVRKFLKTRSNYTILAWGGLLCAYSVVYILYIIADYYAQTIDLRAFILSISYLIGVFGAFFFSYNTEREIKVKTHFFSLIMLSFLSFLILNMFISILDPIIITILTWLFFIILVVIYIKRFTSKTPEKKWRINVYSLVIGIVLMIVGFGGVADIAVSSFGGLWVRVLGNFLMIGGMILISALFIGVPSLAEFDWAQKIRILNIIHINGVSIARYSFGEEAEDGKNRIDDLLMAGGLMSISQVISNLIKSDKKLDFVDHGDVKLLLEHGKYLINVLVADESLEILRTKLKTFTEQIEFIYEDNLVEWDGDLEQFKFLDAIVKANFQD